MMKYIAFIIIVVANFSDNGKASVDSLVPVSANILQEDNTRYSDKSCNRPCKFNVKPRRCEYKFKLAPMINEDGKASIAINDMIPGPPITVCVNDIIVVEVENKIPEQDVAIHWHGLDQKGTPYMDGVPMVTQCPIGFGSRFKYAFRASSPGTFFYHADSVSHQSDGIYGPLIVNQPQPMEPHAGLYDYDRSQENTLLASVVFPKLLTGSLEDLSQIKPEALHINGDADSSKIFVMEKYAYRLRFINAIGVNCPVIFNIESHEMTVIASDTNPVKSVTARNILLYPGERMDVVIRATQEPRGYWISVRGVSGTCSGLIARGMLIYSGFNYTSMLQEQNQISSSSLENEMFAVQGQMLKSLKEANYKNEIKTIYLSIDKKKLDGELVNDFRYISDAIPKKPYFPAALSLQENGVVQINGKSFLYPSVPLLLRPREVKPESICKIGEENKHKEPQCLQVLTIDRDEVIELVLVNEGFGSNDTYSFHLHGYSMHVVATWQNTEVKPVSKDDVMKMDKAGKISRNIFNPPIKDTIMVPNKGYTIVRIKPDQAGDWMLECRECSLYSLPTAIVISLPQQLPKSIIDSLQKCGNYRPPDVLLN